MAVICPSCQKPHDTADFTCPACNWAPKKEGEFCCFAPEVAYENSGFDENIFKCFAKARDSHFMLWYRNRLVVEAIRRYFPQARDILEAGAGSGMVLEALVREFPDRTIDASELFLSGLEMIRRVIGEAPVRLFQMDATRMPFRDAYDLIGMFDVIEHIDDDALVIENLADALRPQGGVILTVPQHPALWSRADDAVHHKRRYRPGELTAKLSAGGFEILRATSYNMFLVPAMVAGRLIERGEYNPEREWSLHPALNALFLGVSKFEKCIIDAGIDLPVGGSQIVIARKR